MAVVCQRKTDNRELASMTTMNDIEIRTLTSRHAEVFQATRIRAVRAFPEAYLIDVEEEIAAPLEEVAQRLSPNANRCVFGAFVGDSLVGILGLVREERPKLQHKAFIWGMYVDPTYHRRGIGRQLMEAALSHAKSMQGLRRIGLTVTANNSEAIALYEALGFKPWGTEPAALVVDGVDLEDVHMSYEL